MYPGKVSRADCDMDWTGETTTARGVVERCFRVTCENRRVPGILWSPETTVPAEPRASGAPLPLVLIGHGGSGHKRQAHLLGLARRWVRHHGIAAAAIDGPLHGDRRPDDLAADDVEQTRRRFARPQLADQMIADWQATLDGLQKLPELGIGPVGYWGLSMGTLFGVPLLAAEPRVQVAVLGLMGIRPDGGAIAARLARDAPEVRCPLLFLQQRQDELFAVETSGRLFDALGSSDKRLHAHPGRHAAVPREAFLFSESFLADRLTSSGR